jgi:hypothetical protein
VSAIQPRSLVSYAFRVIQHEGLCVQEIWFGALSKDQMGVAPLVLSAPA